jgi:hypothetical protein
MKSAFIITSALNTKFGVFKPEQRVQQTLDTIASIRRHVPDAKIYAVELAGVTPSDEQRSIMEQHTDCYIDLSADPAVVDIYNSTDNWDIVKNTTEVMGFGTALGMLVEQGLLDNIDRVFKISGRYTLSDDFNIKQFEELPGRIVVAQRRKSQFGPALTGGIDVQYMSRLWSWPADKTSVVLESYSEGFLYIAQTLANGGYCDIEHMLFKYLPADLVTEVAKVGIQGNIAPNGQAVVD